MEPFERKLNSVRSILDQRERAARSAEQRKNELVLYLAHDIRTPLTSVLGYLDLLEEMPELPAEERAKYVHISLEKARRLEKMISEFFEITRYNTQQIAIDPKPVDLYYLLVQVIDEHIPLFTEHGNYVTLRAQDYTYIYSGGRGEIGPGLQQPSEKRGGLQRPGDRGNRQRRSGRRCCLRQGH